MNPLLEVKDVCLSYHSLSGETAALSHISFHLMPEEFLAVVGPSGCGKSTLLNLICGLLHAESGTILVNGKPLNKDMICPLSSRQVKYLKVSDKNTYISFWSVGIFMHTISLYIF